MEKLNNWNAWCNDKVLLHSFDSGLPVLLSPNAVLAVEQAEDHTTIALVDGLYFDVKETAEEFLGLVGELVKESDKRREAQVAAQQEQYKKMMAEQASKKPSEG